MTFPGLDLGNESRRVGIEHTNGEMAVADAASVHQCGTESILIEKLGGGRGIRIAAGHHRQDDLAEVAAAKLSIGCDLASSQRARVGATGTAVGVAERRGAAPARRDCADHLIDVLIAGRTEVRADRMSQRLAVLALAVRFEAASEGLI